MQTEQGRLLTRARCLRSAADSLLFIFRYPFTDPCHHRYSHADYIKLLEGLREAVETEERLRWEMVAAQARVEVWRSQEASNRAMDKITI